MLGILVGLLVASGAESLAVPRRTWVSMSVAEPAPAASPSPQRGGSRRSSRANRQSQVFIDDVVETRGGFIVDLRHTSFGSSESWHSLTMSKDKLSELTALLPEGMEARPDMFAAAVIKFLASNLPSVANTEGTLDPAQFPINYFSVRQVWHFFPEATPALVELMQGADLIAPSERVTPGQEVPQPWNLCPPASSYKECDFSNAKPAEPVPGTGDMEESSEQDGTPQGPETGDV